MIQTSERDHDHPNSFSDTSTPVRSNPATPGETEAVLQPNMRTAVWVYHGMILLFSAAVLSVAAMLSVRGQRQVILPWLQQPLPEICLFRNTLGIDCPGCGLTRAFISLSHGEFSRAFRFNPASIPLFLLVVLQIPYRALRMWRRRPAQRVWNPSSFTWVLWGTAVILLLQWIVKLATMT